MRRTPAPLARSRSDTDAARSRAKTPDTREREEQSVLQAMADNSPQALRLTRMADQWTAGPRQVRQRALADRLSAQALRATAPAPAPIQCVAGKSGFDNLAAAIHEGTGQATKIAQDLYRVDVGNEHDGKFETETRRKIGISARSLGYDDQNAERLASNTPYTKEDLEDNTRSNQLGTSASQMYELETFRDYTCPNPSNSNLHPLHFVNEFGIDGTAKFCRNFRNPAMATFYATDVFDAQRNFLRENVLRGAPPDVTQIVRSNVVSTSGNAWMGGAFSAGEMNSERLRSFLTTTVNGKSSARIAESLGKAITRGRVTGTANNWSVTLHLQTKSSGQTSASSAISASATTTRSEQMSPAAVATEQASSTLSDAEKASRLLEDLKSRFSRLPAREPATARTIAGYIAHMDRLLPRLAAEPELMPVFMRILETADKDLK